MSDYIFTVFRKNILTYISVFLLNYLFFIHISNNTAPKGFDKVGVESDFSAPIVEYGTGGDYRWQQPRPFMQSTEDELKRGDLIKSVIKEIDYIK